MKRSESVEIVELKDLAQDARNAREHTARNIGMIEQALREVGAARSGVVDEEMTLLAGNGTYEALAAAGITSVKVVDAGGDEWVVVRRRGLTEEQKIKVSLYDNRAAELASWNVEQVTALMQQFPGAIRGVWREEELKELMKKREAPNEFPIFGDDIATNRTCPKCGFSWSGPEK